MLSIISINLKNAFCTKDILTTLSSKADITT